MLLHVCKTKSNQQSIDNHQNCYHACTILLKLPEIFNFSETGVCDSCNFPFTLFSRIFPLRLSLALPIPCRPTALAQLVELLAHNPKDVGLSPKLAEKILRQFYCNCSTERFYQGVCI